MIIRPYYTSDLINLIKNAPPGAEIECLDAPMASEARRIATHLCPARGLIFTIRPLGAQRCDRHEPNPE